MTNQLQCRWKIIIGSAGRAKCLPADDLPGRSSDSCTVCQPMQIPKPIASTDARRAEGETKAAS